MTLLDYRFVGEPVGEGRPRAARQGGFIRIHPDPKSKEWRSFAAETIAREWSRPPHEGPVSLRIVSVAKRPKRLLRKKDPECRVWCTSKPDADNIAKIVMDALVDGGVLRDDTLVVNLEVWTLYASKTEGPCVEIIMEGLGALLPGPINWRNAP